jgi:adenylate kinase
MNLMIAGIQGSGKGTHASTLAEIFSLKHVSFGDAIKECLVNDTALVYPYTLDKYNNGELAPDDVLFKVADKYLSQNGFILDGFPRTQGQMDYVLNNFKIDHCIYLELEEETAISRLKERGRSDDTDESIKRRLTQFNQITKPIFKVLEDRGIMTRVDANGTREEVFNNIIEIFAV